MDRSSLLRLWNAHHDENTWITGFAASVGGLTPEQAAWKPKGTGGEPRHSIWQIVHHMCFWREYHIERSRGGKGRSAEEVARLNWPEPESVTPGAWAAACDRFAASHAAIAGAIADETLPGDKFPFILTHDAYHAGQIMQIRAMQGLKPIE